MRLLTVTLSFTLSLALSHFVFAQDSSNPIHNPVPTPNDIVAGHWKVISRTCSSGAPVRDNFVMGRDSILLSFFNGNYDGRTTIGNCNIWLTGKYDVKDNMLRVFNLSGASSCQPQPIFNNITQFFTVENSQLKLYFGPSKSYYDSCPPGDMMESVFEHVGQ